MYLYNNAERTHRCVYMIKRNSCLLLTATLDSTEKNALFRVHCYPNTPQDYVVLTLYIPPPLQELVWYLFFKLRTFC